MIDLASFAVALSWGCWILATLWLLFRPSRLSLLAFTALMLTSFYSCYLTW